MQTEKQIAGCFPHEFFNKSNHSLLLIEEVINFYIEVAIHCVFTHLYFIAY